MNSQHRPEASTALPSRCCESCPLETSNYSGAGTNKVEAVSNLTRQTGLEVERRQSGLHGYSGPLPVADKQGEEKRMLTIVFRLMEESTGEDSRYARLGNLMCAFLEFTIFGGHDSAYQNHPRSFSNS